MNLRTLFVLTLLATPAGMPAYASENLTTPAQPLELDAALRMGLEQNQDLKRIEASARSASWKRLEAAAPYIPHLSASVNQLLDSKYAYLGVHFGGAAVEFPSATPSSIVSLDASWTLFDGLESWRAYEAADLSDAAARAEWNRARFQTTQTVRLKYYQVLAALELLKVADQNIITLQEHLAIANVSQRSGMSTRFHVLRIEAQLEEAKAEKNLAEDNARLARESLYQVMGLADDGRMLTGALPVPREPGTLTQSPDELKARDDVQAQLKRTEAAARMAGAAEGFWWPRISLYLDDQYYHFTDAYDPSVVETQGYKNAYALGARLTWNLFDGGASLARQIQAGHRAEEADLAAQALLLRAGNDFANWRRRLAYNTGLYRARLRTEEKSQESVRLATLGLKTGTTTNGEVLDAELDLFRSRAGIVRAQMDAAEALINLELAVGHALK